MRDCCADGNGRISGRLKGANEETGQIETATLFPARRAKQTKAEFHFVSFQSLFVEMASHQSFSLERADGSAKYANHANAERIRRGDRFSQRVNVLSAQFLFLSRI